MAAEETPTEFGRLLRSLASEHKREVDGLRAQIAQLRHDSSRSALGSGRRHSEGSRDSCELADNRSLSTEGSDGGLRALSSASLSAAWAPSPRPPLPPPSPACPAFLPEELGLSRSLRDEGHEMTPFLRSNASSAHGPVFGPRVHDSGLPRPSPSGAPGPEKDTDEKLDQKDEVTQGPMRSKRALRAERLPLRPQSWPCSRGNSRGNSAEPETEDVTAPTMQQQLVEMAGCIRLAQGREGCSEVGSESAVHIDLEMHPDIDSNAGSQAAVSMAESDDQAVSICALQEASDHAGGDAFAMLPVRTSPLPAETAQNWKGLLRAVELRLEEQDQVVFNVSDVWKDAARGKKSSFSNTSEGSTLELSSVLRFLKADWLRDGHAPGEDGAGAGEQKAQRLRRCFARWTVHPNGYQRMFWDCLGSILLLHDLIMIPMTSFEGSTTGMPKSYKEFEERFQPISAFFWTSDILVSFNTGYHSSEGFVEMDPFKVARNYFRTWFIFDLAIVVVDWVSLFISSLAEASDTMRLGKTASRVMRVFRLLRFMKLNVKLNDIMQTINSEYIQQLMGLLKMLVLIVFVNHYVACFWFLVSAQNFGGQEFTWVKLAFALPDQVPTLKYAYTTSLHWSLTQFTPASMEVTPENYVERTYNIVVIITALVVFSSFVSSITSTMTHIRNMNNQQMQQETAIRGFFTEHHVPPRLVSRVWHCIHHHSRTVKKRTRLEAVEALSSLPTAIKNELRDAVFIPILKVHPLFFEYGRIDPQAMSMISKTGSRALTEYSVQGRRELVLVTQQESGLVKELVFVVRGTLEYPLLGAELPPEPCHGNRGTSLAYPTSAGLSVMEKQWCCEAALWLAEASLEGALVAADGGCEVVSVHSKCFQDIAKTRPESLGLVAQYALLFTERFNIAQENPDNNGLLFNSEDVIREIVEESVQVNLSRLKPKRTAVERNSLADMVRSSVLIVRSN